MHADFIRKCSISNPPQPLLTEPDSHQESATGPPLPPPPSPRYVRIRDINYLAKFCSELSSVTQLQNNLTKEDMPFLWSTKHQQAFDSAKALATSAACLAYFDVTAPLILQVDASDYGQGAALLQTIKPHSSSALDESSLRPIAYCKRPNHYRRVLYLAIVEALNTFKELLLGKSNSLYRPSTLSFNLQEGLST